MLEIKIVVSESYDEETQLFSPHQEVTVQLEHSLLSLSKWESKHEKRFIGNEDLSPGEIFDYVLCMNLTPEIPPEVFLHLSDANMIQIRDYIQSSQTGTTFPPERPGPMSRELISNELIYYWMVKCQIPWAAETWHINRLFTLIHIYTLKENAQNSKNKTPSERVNANAERRAENARRRAAAQSTG